MKRLLEWLKMLPYMLIAVFFHNVGLVVRGLFGAMFLVAIIEDFNTKSIWVVFDFVIYPIGVLRGIGFYFGII